MSIVYRVQDADGRGPFRPGFSKVWMDERFFPGMGPLPTWMEEFGVDNIVRRCRGRHIGSAVMKLTDLGRWFSPTERRRLKFHKFNVVSIEADEILAESKNQVVFASVVPLSEASRLLPWF